jgi:hypothetical protein
LVTHQDSVRVLCPGYGLEAGMTGRWGVEVGWDGGRVAAMEQMKPGPRVEGLVPSAGVEIDQVDWHRADTVEFVYRFPDGATENRLLSRFAETRLEVITGESRPWALDADGEFLAVSSTLHESSSITSRS